VTTVRLVGSTAVSSKFMRDALGTREDTVTTVRLAMAVYNTERATTGLKFDSGRPALLVSYAYWKSFAADRAGYAFRDYALDSGAFTVKNSGGTVDLGAYLAFCQERLATDPQCAEVFALDVIGDWQATERNTEAMWRAGVPAIPVFHYGEPEALLTQMASAYPKLALGGLVGLRKAAKIAYVEQAFARVYPKRIHGFGLTGEDLLMRVPFDSVDASNWELAPAAFGNYKSMGKPVASPRGKAIDLRAEVEWYLKLERRVAQRWAGELTRLRAANPLTKVAV
jgi:hypothetical protein